MPILKCKMCGGELNIKEDISVCECEYCGSKQTIPIVDDEKKLKLYERANKLRFNCEFDKAASVYESIVADFQDDAEAYWGLLLCRYGIEYVDDPADGYKVPTCHRLSFDSIMDDADFDMVMENADLSARDVYREQAKEIEEIRKGILEVSGKEESYDIFICYKETDENGDRTVDSVIAQNVYDALTDKGYRVFFSRITLEDKLGTEYEPYIFAALNSAQIMLAFGTSYNYYNAVWVKNEWSRYLKLMSKDKEKHLIPCYKDIDAYDIPKEFKHLQAQDMGKVGAIQDLVRGIDKLFGRTEKGTSEKIVVQQTVASNISALVSRGNIALEDGEWEKADGFFEEVLNQNAECAEAYLGKFLSENECSNISSLVELYISDVEEAETEKIEACPEDKERIDNAVSKYVVLDYLLENEIRKPYAFDRTYLSKLSHIKQLKDEALSELSDDKLLSRARKYATGDTKTLIDKVIADISSAFDKRITDAEQEDKNSIASVKQSYEEHLKVADAKAQELYNNALERRETIYSSRVSQMDAAERISDYENIRDALKGMHGYKDTLELADKCQGEIDRLKDEERLEIERREVAKRKEKERLARKKRIIAIVAGVVVVCVIAVIAVIKVIIPNVKYNKAIKLMKSENYEEAIETFEALEGYKDSWEYIEFCENERDYNNAVKLMNDGKYEESMEAFKALEGYKDSDELFTKAELNIMRNASVGDIVLWGNYDGNTEWVVLEKEDGKILVISKYAIGKQPYNKKFSSVSWASCSLRSWLNVYYIADAFNSYEKELLLSTTIINSTDVVVVNDTSDEVFLLSIDEVYKYFPMDDDRKVTLSDGKACWWWLRSPGSPSFRPGVCFTRAAYVHNDGSVKEGGDLVDRDTCAVRPAMWIDISNL